MYSLPDQSTEPDVRSHGRGSRTRALLTVRWPSGCGLLPRRAERLRRRRAGRRPSWSGGSTGRSRAGCTSRGSPRSTRSDQLYIADLTDRIQVFDRDGKLPPRLADARLQRRRAERPDGRPATAGCSWPTPTSIASWSTRPRASSSSRSATACRGRRPGRFGYPTDVVIDRAGNFYVGGVRRERPDPGLLARGEVAPPVGRPRLRAGRVPPAAGPGDRRRRTGSTWPTVATTGSRSSTPQGKLLTIWGTRGTEPGEMSYPYDLAIGPDGVALRLRVRQPPGPEVHARRQAAGRLGRARAAGRGSCTTPGPWPSTAGARSR